MLNAIRDWICEPRLIKSGTTGILGFVTAEHLRGAMQWVVLGGTAFLILTQVATWLVRHFICRPRDGQGPCTACRYFGSWVCPGARRDPEPAERKWE